jgi:hypothetical protein
MTCVHDWLASDKRTRLCVPAITSHLWFLDRAKLCVRARLLPPSGKRQVGSRGQLQGLSGFASNRRGSVVENGSKMGDLQFIEPVWSIENTKQASSCQPEGFAESNYYKGCMRCGFTSLSVSGTELYRRSHWVSSKNKNAPRLANSDAVHPTVLVNWLGYKLPTCLVRQTHICDRI